MYENVDPFIGTGVTDLGAPEGLAATWWWPKPQIGNTHPGACHPFGMVSACPYSGAYPTGYGLYGMSTEGVPPRIKERYEASGFTHFQQSGTGAIRKYYNYVRVTPMTEPLDELGTNWSLTDEEARPGFYAATLDGDIRCELTVGPKSAVHRYLFPPHRDARVVVDFSCGGLDIEHGQTIPVRASLESLGEGRARGRIVVEGVPLHVFVRTVSPGWRQMLWYDRRLMNGGSRLDFEAIRPTTLRPFGFLFRGPVGPAQPVEIQIGFSLRGWEQAEANLDADVGTASNGFLMRRERTTAAWDDHLGRIHVEGGTDDQRTVFATALYHSLVKPCFALDESPFWPSDGPFVFDICTMWDIYKTQIPLITALAPDRAVQLLNALVRVCEEEGNLPIGYRMARGADRFFRQASALAHTALADVCALSSTGNGTGIEGAIDWEWALVHMHADLRRTYGEDYLVDGVVHPLSHTLDLAYGYHCTARVAEHLGDKGLADELDARSTGWVNAFDPDGLLGASSYYEGGVWNYSFRLLHDMGTRIDMAGGDEAFVAMLDRFFGYGADPAARAGVAPCADELDWGHEAGRFEGLNNEPDMEAPFAYHYAGRPDRTAEVVHAVLANQFGTGRGGLPGNDDSGGLSSWLVWASLGLFPVAGQNLFLITTPAFPAASMRIGSRTFRIETTGHRGSGPTNGSTVLHVTAATLNGVPIDRSWLTGNELHAGGTLHLTLSPTTGAWGTTTRPPSHTVPQPADTVRPTRSGNAHVPR